MFSETICSATETEPLCSPNSTAQLPLSAARQVEIYLWMSCTVRFSGNLFPEIEWRQHEGDGEEFLEGRKITHLADTAIIPNSNITSELTVVFSSNSNKALSYSCKIYFRAVNEIHLGTATNAPNYSYTYIWKMPAVKMPSTHLPAGMYRRNLSIANKFIVHLTLQCF